MRSRTAARGILFVLAILAAPLAVGAQPAGRIPRIGWLMPNTPVSPIDSHITQAFRQGAARAWLDRGTAGVLPGGSTGGRLGEVAGREQRRFPQPRTCGRERGGWLKKKEGGPPE